MVTGGPAEPPYRVHGPPGDPVAFGPPLKSKKLKSRSLSLAGPGG